MALRLMLRQCCRSTVWKSNHALLPVTIENACKAADDQSRTACQRSSDVRFFCGAAAPSAFSSTPYRSMSSYTSATLPPIDDEDVSKAINALLASNWQQVSEDVKKQVQSVLSKGGPQAELLKDAWRAAEAVEKFCDKLEQMRMELDDQSHDGNATKDTFAAALEAAKERYERYLASFGLDENWLRKKVEMELGTPIMHLKQRVSGLGAEWSKISLLSTTGIWGSYIERRYEA